MNQKPDATKIEAALKRAADKALHGTREERSGRFLKRDERREYGQRPPRSAERAKPRAAQGLTPLVETHEEGP